MMFSVQNEWIYSTFGVVVASGAAAVVVSSGLICAGPVCVIGTTRSVFNGTAGLRGAVMVNTPSDDRDDWTSFGLLPAGNWYLRVNCLEMKLQKKKQMHKAVAFKWGVQSTYPCSSAFSSCLPSTTMNLSVVLTVISFGVNCCTSKMTWNLSSSTFNVEPDFSRVKSFDLHGRT